MGSLWGQGFHIRVGVSNMGSRVPYWGRGPKWGLYGVKGSILGSGVLNGVFMGSKVQY